MKVIIVPGYSGSIGDHWQAWLQKIIPNSEMIDQESWINPVREKWIKELVKIINKYKEEEILLVAHSLGSATVALLGELNNNFSHILGAILVAPADCEQLDFPTDISGYHKMPTRALPFPSILVGSRNDHYMSFERAKYFSKKWGSEFIDYGTSGHINIDSGFGKWPFILELIERF